MDNKTNFIDSLYKSRKSGIVDFSELPDLQNGGELDILNFASGDTLGADQLGTMLGLTNSQLTSGVSLTSTVPSLSSNTSSKGSKNSGSSMGLISTASNVLGAVIDNNVKSVYSGVGASTLPGNSETQQTIDSVVGSILPFYSTGKALGDWAKTDYMATNKYGGIDNKGKYSVADTIGMFLDPLSSFISGLSGEGWTPQDRLKKINKKAGENKAREERFLMEKSLAMERKANPQYTFGFGAAYGGDVIEGDKETRRQKKIRELETILKPVPADNSSAYKPDDNIITNVLSVNERISIQRKLGRLKGAKKYRGSTGGFFNPIDSNPNKTRCVGDGNTVSKSLNLKALGGGVIRYNVGGTHEQNPYGGIPVDNLGNPTSISKSKPVATVEEDEVSWLDPNTGSAYIFSNRLKV